MISRSVAAYVRWRDSLPDLSGVDAVEAWRIFDDLHENRCSCCRGLDRCHERVIDHDHTTGYIRGFLCRGCNFHASSGIAHRPLSAYPSPLIPLYCQYPPAAAAGLVKVYADPAPDSKRHLVTWQVHPNGQAEAWRSQRQAMLGAKAIFDAVGL